MTQDFLELKEGKYPMNEWQNDRVYANGSRA